MGRFPRQIRPSEAASNVLHAASFPGSPTFVEFRSLTIRLSAGRSVTPKLGRFPGRNPSLSSLQIGRASQAFTARVFRLGLEGDYSHDFSSPVVPFSAFGKRRFFGSIFQRQNHAVSVHQISPQNSLRNPPEQKVTPVSVSVLMRN